jgi:hypothetical protein
MGRTVLSTSMKQNFHTAAAAGPSALRADREKIKGNAPGSWAYARVQQPTTATTTAANTAPRATIAYTERACPEEACPASGRASSDSASGCCASDRCASTAAEQGQNP